MQIKSEQDILNPGIRKQIIDEINGAENQRRRAEAFKRYECLKDRTDFYVLELLLQQFDRNTVWQMQYAVTNLSIARKIVDKLARVYQNGVKRTVTKDEKSTKAVEEIAGILNVNTRMKKLNRYLKAFRNVLAYVAPVKHAEGGQEKYGVELKPMPPHLFDVIEDPNRPEEPMVVILSNYTAKRQQLYALNAATAGRTSPEGQSMLPARGDGVDQAIADDPTDKPDNQYIWWSKSFHFTTDEKGAIIGEAGKVENEIAELPFVSFAADQDGAFWSLGGNDLVDGAIKINALLSNINHIGVQQGYGQMYMKGKNLPKSIQVGPTHCIQMEYEKDDPVPEVGFITANPPLNDLKSQVEGYLALLLSTNNLSTTGFRSSLDGANDFASGISLLIDKAESIEDVEDQAQVFRDKEPKIWHLIARWLAKFAERDLLIDALSQFKLPDEFDVKLQFPQAQTIVSEKEKLEILEKRKELGLNTEVEILMRDDPALDEKAAEEKLAKIREEKQKAMQDAVDNAAALGGDTNGDQDAPGNAQDAEDGADPEMKPKGGKQKPPGAAT